MGEIIVVKGSTIERYINISKVDFIEGLLLFTEEGKRYATKCFSIEDSNPCSFKESCHTSVSVHTHKDCTLSVDKLHISNCANISGVVESVKVQNCMHLNGYCEHKFVDNKKIKISKEDWKAGKQDPLVEKPKKFNLEVILSGWFDSVNISPPYEVHTNLKRAEIGTAEVGNCLWFKGNLVTADVGNCLYYVDKG